VKDTAEGMRLLALGAEQGDAASQIVLATINRAAGVPDAAVPRGAATVLAHMAQSEVPRTRSELIDMLGETAGDRNVARACCIGCGNTEQLQVCAKCRTAKFCSRECQRRMWPAHKQACRAWAEQKAAAAAEAGGASSSARG
jgi:hypothetical protein